MMVDPIKATHRFFRVIVRKQSYLNLIYLLAAFPLSVFYFVFLVSGLSTGVSLAIVWVGIPLLMLVGVGWWVLAIFERFMAIHVLKEDVPAMRLPPGTGEGILATFKHYLVHPVTWKSPVYLLLKFPLGIATFVILATLISLTLAFLTLPLTYELLDFQIGGFFSPDRAVWQVDGLGEALLGTLVGLILWPVTMQIVNGLAWVHAKFARVMLSADPMSQGLTP
jgi:hypothetical protein